MARDYSKTNTSGRHKKSKTSGFKLVLLSFLVGYLAASLINLEGLGLWLEKQKSLYFPKQKSQAKHLASTQQTAELPKPKFEFYTLLTKERQSTSFAKPAAKVSEAIPPTVKAVPSSPAKVDQARSPAQPVAAASSVKYLIQVASFRSIKDAERLKATLALKGFDVAISETAQGNYHWYRVVTGPYTDLIKAEKAQTNIARSERVMGMILKQNA